MLFLGKIDFKRKLNFYSDKVCYHLFLKMKCAVLVLLTCFVVAVSSLDFTVYVEGEYYYGGVLNGSNMTGLALTFNRTTTVYASAGPYVSFAGTIHLAIDVPVANCTNSTLRVEAPVVLNTSNIDMSSYVLRETYDSLMVMTFVLMLTLVGLIVFLAFRYFQAMKRIKEFENQKEPVLII